jgi:probable addiction module antidote protein
MKEKITLSKFDPADYLESQEDINFYLQEAFTTGEPEDIALAIGDAIRAQGMLKTAKKTGLDRSSLYHSFSKAGGDPRLSTLSKVISTLGYRLSLTKISHPATIN